jgi:hypothetical protein
MHHTHKNRRGSTLILVLIVTVVLTILGTSILSVALANTKNTIRQENSMKAYFVARSGAMTLAEYIVNNPTADVIGMISAGLISPVEIADGTVSVGVNIVSDELIISSTGIVNGVSQNVDVVLEKSAGPVFDFPIFTKNDISISNHVTVLGDVATNATDISQVSTKPHAKPQAKDVILDADVVIPSIVVPGSFDQVINDRITNNYGIDISGNTSVHLEGGVGLSNKKTFSITGSGTLHLYVSGGWTSANHSEFVSDPDVMVIIYIIDSSNVYIRSHEFKGVIYAPNSIVTFENSSGSAQGGRNFYGSIIAKSVHLDGNHTVFEYAPNFNSEDMTIESLYGIKEIR